MFIVSFNGQCFNGKDVAADYLVSRIGNSAKRCAFGDKVKEVYMQSFNVDRAFVEKWKRIDVAPPGFEQPVRHSLQFIGDGFRQIKPSIWVDWLFRFYENQDIIISDGRYYSECDAVKAKGGINIGVWRPGHENSIQHPSESQLKPEIDKLKEIMPAGGKIDQVESAFDWFLVNDGSLEDLYATIDNELIPYLKKVFN